ncbi:hypothetical protein WDZ92_30195 [Nostoc sp. NIES-2111]
MRHARSGGQRRQGLSEVFKPFDLAEELVNQAEVMHVARPCVRIPGSCRASLG